LRRNKRWQRTILRGFDPDGLNTTSLGIFPHVIEQHGFSHAAEAHHHYALGRLAPP
jgi:hypothetical protein